ncbi:MAG: hypothetical protein JSV91_03240 [Phycisphaerales bacterium]|nr:MAG: hypothetical protein JSV91_03240 [Phycisphaerales bacterium]
MMRVPPANPVGVFYRRAIAIAVLVLACVGFSAGCESRTQPSSAGGDGAVERTAERGPVRMSVRADRSEVSVGDAIEMLVEVVAEPGVDVEMPVLEDTLSPFEVRDRRTPPDIPDGDKRRWTHQYTLCTFDSGDLEIPPLTVRFTDRRVRSDDEESQGEPVSSDLVSEPVRIHVDSALAAEFDPAAYRDIKDAVDVPVDRQFPYTWAIVIGAALIILIILTLILLRRRKTAEAAPVALPAHVWALGQLDGLADERLLQRGSIQEFYFRLSSIVRQYIERRFALMAPERTTDEFLREAGRSQALRGEHKNMLAGFLRAADMVKFALHMPPVEEGDSAMVAARSFIEQTAMPEERLPSNGEASRTDQVGGAA